ncbi:class I SAM-dependent DNA methyltransferase [Streptosporangium sp. NPDC048047]|uniref:class I SAM-dependent DNA methyltransferase n=1 Tax=Streptosporangium sp. NPDC048047 TaxID=3155748 RepID=UPI00341E1BC5
MSFDSIVNRGDYFSAHYLAEVLPKDLKRSGGLLSRWNEREKAGDGTPRRGLRALGRPYFSDRPLFAGFDARLRAGEPADPDERAEWRKKLTELHGETLKALGFTETPRELTVERAGREYTVPVARADRHLVAVECGWAADADAALDEDLAGRLLEPVRLDGNERIISGAKLASWLFAGDEPPRYVLILVGGVIILADRATWGEGRYLAVSLDIALGRNNPAELEVVAALFGADSLLPPEEGGSEPLAELLTNSRNHAVGVSTELRKGLQQSVELIANEVLDRIRQAEMPLDDGTVRQVRPEDVMEPGALAKELGREALRYLYRVLFLLYAEARPELGILPTDDEDYGRGYSLARLGDLVVRDLTGEESRDGFHLYESLDLLFRLVNGGELDTGDDGDTAEDAPGASEAAAGKEGDGSRGEGLRFEPLRADLFDSRHTGLIGREAMVVPGHDEDDPDAPRIDTRLRNATLHRVLRLLMLTRGRRKERGGFISYAQLGINQLGAVYEGLMSYTGFIAAEELYEVAKNGDPKDGSWMIPASKVDDYPESVFVPAVDEDGNRTGEYVRYRQGAFVYRLAGRDRETSASYYTPESLTKVTVQLALQHRLDQDDTVTPAREILEWKICEPALGSGAFLNEAVNQVAAEYLRRRQKELDVRIDPDRYEDELQKVKAYVALHNSYGVDLNETAIELAEVSVWLNVMYPGLRAPWFGLHLRRGNSLIGAGRRVYGPASLTKGAWLKEAPGDLPFSAGPLPTGKVHHFLLPAEGWGAVAGAKEARELAPAEAKRLGDWRRRMRAKVSDKKSGGRKSSQLQRLQALSGRAEYLWDLVVQRLTISEREISRRIDVWGADWIDQPADAVRKEKVYGDLIAPGTPYWRLKKVMDAWCALWFWPLDRAGLLDGTADVYARRASDTPSDHASDGVSPAAQADVRPGPSAGERSAAASEGADRPATGASTGASSAASAGASGIASGTASGADEPTGFGGAYVTDSLFSLGDKQLDLAAYALDAKTAKPARTGGPTKPVARRARPTLEPLRPVIPLADLDDWLDFAEAMLGRADIPEDSLVASFASLADLEVYEDELQAWMGMDSPNRLPERFPWLHPAEDIAEQQGFFHWELQFAQVFKRGGFDLQMGNPPWVRPTWQEDAVLAELEPWFKLTEKPSIPEWRNRKTNALLQSDFRIYYINNLSANMGVVEFIGSGIAYPLLAGTQPDLYRAFMCRAWANLGRVGIAGLIHPGTHFGGIKEGKLRAAAYSHIRFHAHFVNGGNWAFPRPVGDTTEFGCHIYGSTQKVNFSTINWLYSASVVFGSLAHDGTGETPGIKYEGKWDLRPHRERIIKIDEDVLSRWQRLIATLDTPVEQTSLLYPVAATEADAIEAYASYVNRLGEYNPRISSGYHEKTAKDDGLICWKAGACKSLDEVVIQGPHFGIATLFAKQPKDPCRSTNDWYSWDLVDLPTAAGPVTNYKRSCDRETYIAAQDHWVNYRLLKQRRESGIFSEDLRGASYEELDRDLRAGATKPYTSFYRLAWRRMIPFNTERSLFAALIPPGPAHVDAVHTLALPDNRGTALTAGFWASLPLDYLLRITGRSDLRNAEANAMPAADPRHPLAPALLMRTLRLNCLTEAYAEIWGELFHDGRLDDARPGEPGTWVKGLSDEGWAIDWPGLAPLNAGVGPEWTAATPLRTERERRAALVEIDALVAVWLGISADQLAAVYRSRFPVLADRENEIWFDSRGRKIAGNYNTFGYGQTKQHFEQLMAHLDPEAGGPVPDGYTAPFHKANREAEYRQAHAVFSERLRRSGWQPPAAPDGGGAS